MKKVAKKHMKPRAMSRLFKLDDKIGEPNATKFNFKWINNKGTWHYSWIEHTMV
jgi:hypothetical protein